MKSAICHICRSHEIKESDLVRAEEIGRRQYDGGEIEHLVWKWIDKRGHYGYAGEPETTAEKVFMK
jgi:hypothetical protein